MTVLVVVLAVLGAVWLVGTLLGVWLIVAAYLADRHAAGFDVAAGEACELTEQSARVYPFHTR